MGIGTLIIGDEILSGKRQDKHLPHVIDTLAARGLGLDFVHYLGDDRGRLTALLRDSFARGDLVFSFGGIGATPDDHTRQAAAAALDLPLVRHPEAVAELEARFGAEAYPHRVLMAEFPGGQPYHPESGQSRRGVLHSRPSLLPGFPADGVADDGLGARDVVSGPRARPGPRSALSWSTTRGEPAVAADERQRHALSDAQALQPAVVHARWRTSASSSA